MTDLYLVAHKVREEPAFDVALRMTCPLCEGQCGEDYTSCHECDSLGYWWIVPTSGHRAYPWWNKPFSRISCEGWLAVHNDPWRDIPPMPPDLPDHYPHREAPRVSLVEALGLTRPAKPLTPIQRRF